MPGAPVEGTAMVPQRPFASKRPVRLARSRAPRPGRRIRGSSRSSRTGDSEGLEDGA